MCVRIESNESFSSSVRSKKKKALRDAINAKDGQLLDSHFKEKTGVIDRVQFRSINGLLSAKCESGPARE